MAKSQDMLPPLRLWRATTTTSEASTSLETPPPPQDSHDCDNTEEIGVSTAAGMRTEGAGARKRRSRRNVRGGEAGGRQLTNFVHRLPALATEPGMIMQVSTFATVLGGACLLLAVFSGPVLALLTVITLGLCGIGYSIRQRGVLLLLPSGVAQLLTETTLLEFLTDTRVFDAIKTYLIFMMGLSPQETERVLRTLPENMQATLTRPGLLHTLPQSLQGLLLPDSNRPFTRVRRVEADRAGPLGTSVGIERCGEVRRRRRRRQPIQVEGGRGGVIVRRDGGHGDHTAVGRRMPPGGGEEEEGEIPFGLLVWNPLAVDGMVPPSAIHQNHGNRDSGDREHYSVERDRSIDADDSQIDGIDGEDDGGSDRNDHEQEQEYESHSDDDIDGDDGDDASVIDRNAANHADVASANRRENVNGHPRHVSVHRPWDAPPNPPPLPLATARPRPRSRLRSNSDGSRAAQHVSSPAAPGASRRRAVSSARGAERGLLAGGRLRPSPARAAASDGLVPSAERIVASILQSRVDNAVRAAWNMVDQRRLKRAAIGSGAALAVHMALSQRARLQAGAMLRGSVLAALAGTATVCACLAYVSPARQNDDEHDGSSSQPQAILAAPEEQATNSRRRWYGESRNEAAPDAGRTDESEAQGSRLRTYRAGLQRWMTRLAPSAQRLVRILGMICLLLAVRKWQMLRRAAMRAAAPRSTYGSLPYGSLPP